MWAASCWRVNGIGHFVHSFNQINKKRKYSVGDLVSRS
jgi:hypothetical protein